MTREKKFTSGAMVAYPQRGAPGHCHAAQVFGPNGDTICVIEPTADEAEASATATLFAASSELLAAVEAIIDRVNSQEVNSEIRRFLPGQLIDAEIALMKAYGETK